MTAVVHRDGSFVMRSVTLAHDYGYRLLSKVVNELKNQGFEEVFLWVLEDNHRARKFYEKFGFLCTGDYIEDSIGGKELREVRYIYRFNNEKE